MASPFSFFVLPVNSIAMRPLPRLRSVAEKAREGTLKLHFYLESIAEYLGRLARVRVTQIFPRKTYQPVTIGVICLYMRRLNSDGFGAQTRH